MLEEKDIGGTQTLLLHSTGEVTFQGESMDE